MERVFADLEKKTYGILEYYESENSQEKMRAPILFLPVELKRKSVSSKRRFVYEIKRLRKDKKLPVVLSHEEVSQILSSVNKKYKT